MIGFNETREKWLYSKQINVKGLMLSFHRLTAVGLIYPVREIKRVY